jgi:hypothetical protein
MTAVYGRLTLPMDEHSRSPFGVIVEYHLGKIGWKRGDLAVAAKVSEPQISGWISGKRPIGRDHVNRVVWALAFGYREKNVLAHLDTLDALMNEFLVAAGFSAVTGASDLVWTQLKSKTSAAQPLLPGDEMRVLRIGWVDYSFFSYRLPEKDDPQGLAVAIITRIARLIGAAPSWIECKWEDVVTKLQAREIDVVCPILIVLPSRQFQVQFTSPIPGIDLSINGVLNGEHRYASGKKERHIAPLFVRGEVGEELCTLLIPEATTLENCASLDEARKIVLNSPLNRESVRCLIADHMMCQNLVEKYPRLELLRPKPPRSEIELPVAIAVHEGEPRLLSLFNSCLQLLEKSTFFFNCIKNRRTLHN